MSGLFSIPVGGLKVGQHTFDFEINNTFFDQFEGSEIKEGLLQVTVEADKRASHIDLVIVINGVVSLLCDRCLGQMSQPVECTNRLLVKFGKTHDESDPEIITMPAEEYELNMEQYFYEYILLALPIKRVHPDNKNGKSTCDPDMLNRLKEHIVGEEAGTDPRWDELKKLMNNN
jgi:uncharacterized protein